MAQERQAWWWVSSVMYVYLPAREAGQCLAGCPGGKGGRFGDQLANVCHKPSTTHHLVLRNKVGRTHQTMEEERKAVTNN